jgi:hypothetical protein
MEWSAAAEPRSDRDHDMSTELLRQIVDQVTQPPQGGRWQFAT